MRQKTESEYIIDEEIKRLRQVVMAFNSMTEEEQYRVFQYLKDKYETSWPN